MRLVTQTQLKLQIFSHLTAHTRHVSVGLIGMLISKVLQRTILCLLVWVIRSKGAPVSCKPLKLPLLALHIALQHKTSNFQQGDSSIFCSDGTCTCHSYMIYESFSPLTSSEHSLAAHFIAPDMVPTRLGFRPSSPVPLVDTKHCTTTGAATLTELLVVASQWHLQQRQLPFIIGD